MLMQEHAIFTVSGGEGTDRRAAEPLAVSPSSHRCRVRAPGGGGRGRQRASSGGTCRRRSAARLLGAAIVDALADMASVGPRRLLDERAANFGLGQTTPEGGEAARREVRELQELQRTLARSLGDLRERLEERGLPKGLHLPPLPVRGKSLGRVHLDRTGLPTVDRARTEFVERAGRLAARRRGSEPAPARTAEELAPVAPEAEESQE